MYETFVGRAALFASSYDLQAYSKQPSESYRFAVAPQKKS